MKLVRLFRVKKSRKYPIQYNDRGLSLRARCFERFNDGERPVEVAKELETKVSTVKKYFQDWKKFGPDFDKQYIFTKGLFKKTASNRDYNLDLFARAWGIQTEELETLLGTPHGLRRLITGKFLLPGHANADHKRQISLEVALCISDHLVKKGGKVGDVRYALNHWMKEMQEHRKEEDANIEEENREIAFTRGVLEAAVRAEREGRPKRDRLTEDEKKVAIKFGTEAKMEQGIRNGEFQYWARIGELAAEGLTREQAREKIYQDLLDKDDLEGAKMMRAYQYIINPLKADVQDLLTASPTEPPSPA